MKKSIASLIAAGMAIVLAAGCGSSKTESSGGYGNNAVSVKNDYALSYEDALEEVNTLANATKPTKVPAQLDLDAEELAEDAALADISTYEMTVNGSGEIDIEIAAATELSSNAPDDWINVVAEKFNKSGASVNGKSVSVSIRKIASGEVVTYMVDGGYRPDAFVPSNFAWGEMLQASGINTEKITDRIVGNTAGILMSDEIYDTYKDHKFPDNDVLPCPLGGIQRGLKPKPPALGMSAHRACHAKHNFVLCLQRSSGRPKERGDGAVAA